MKRLKLSSITLLIAVVLTLLAVSCGGSGRSGTGSTAQPPTENPPPVTENRSPRASLAVNRSSGEVPLEVTLDSSRSSDPDEPNDSIVRFAWDLDGNGSFEVDDGGPMQTRTYDRAGSFSVGVRVFDSSGASDAAALTINVNPGSGGGSSNGRGDWWAQGGSAKRQGRSSVPGPEDNTERWRFSVGEPVDSPVFASDGTAYMASMNTLYAISSDGVEKWRFQFSEETSQLFAISVVLDQSGIVYFGTDNSESPNFLIAVNPDGSERWRFPLGDPVTGSPVVGSDGTIYVGSDKFYAINPDGSEKWNFESDRRFGTNPALGDDGTVYVAIFTDASGGTVYALAPDGSPKWQGFVSGAPFGDPAVADDGTIYVAGEFGDLKAFNPDGSVKWRVEPSGDQLSTLSVGEVAVAADGTVYFATWGGEYELFALNPEDGSVRWIFPIFLNSKPIVDSEGSVYFGGSASPGSDENFMFALNPDGSERWRFETGDEIRARPSIDENGTLFFPSLDGIFYAVGTRTGGALNLPPSASLVVSPESGTAPLQVTLNASQSRDPDGEIVQYEWDWEGDGNFDQSGTEPIVTHSYSRGLFSPTVRVQDDDGVVDVARSELSASIGSNALPEADLSVSPASGSLGATVTLDASGSSDADGELLSFDWDWEGDGNFDLIGGSASETHTYNSAGRFQPTVRVSDDRNASTRTSASLEIQSSGNQLPEAVLTASPSSGDSPLNVMLDASESSDAEDFFLTFDWDIDGDGNYDILDGTEALPEIPIRTFRSRPTGTTGEPVIVRPRVRVADTDGAVAFAFVELSITPETPPTP